MAKANKAHTFNQLGALCFGFEPDCRDIKLNPQYNSIVITRKDYGHKQGKKYLFTASKTSKPEKFKLQGTQETNEVSTKQLGRALSKAKKDNIKLAKGRFTKFNEKERLQKQNQDWSNIKSFLKTIADLIPKP